MEKKSLKVLDAAPDAFVIIDREGNIIFVNIQTEKLFGYKKDELVGQPMEILLPVRFRKLHLGHRVDYISDPRTRPMGTGLDLVARRKDSSEFPVEISLSPIETEDGLVITSAIRDITERRRAEDEIIHLNRTLEKRVIERTAELEYEKKRLKQYIDVAGVIFLVVDSDEKVTLINNKGCEVLGYEEKEIVGKNVFDSFIPEHNKKEARTVFSKLIAGEIEPVKYFQNYVLTKSGEERTIAWHNTVLKDNTGKIYATLSSGEDITDKQALERQVRHSEKLAAMGQLTAGLAHEIGTPLNVIVGRAEYMLRRMSPEDTNRENLERIIHQIDRITKIVDQLLNFTRTKPLEMKRIHLSPVLKGVFSFFDQQLERHHITASLECPENLPEILADSDQIQQVCFNIILNAIQSMPQGGKLSIRANRTIPRVNREDSIRDECIEIAIEDTGTGISPEHLSRIFDPFFTTKEVGKGTGLGLAVSYSIAKSHGGWINVDSRVGEGTVFCIYLPVKPTVELQSIPSGKKSDE